MIHSSYVESKTPQLFVFSEKFMCTDVNNYNTFASVNEQQNVELVKQTKWLNYWTENGEHIVLQKWKEKYMDYLDVNNEEEKVADNLSKEENTLESKNSDIQLDQNISEYDQTWEQLWQNHSESVYFEQYILYNSIYNNYQLDLCNSIFSEDTNDDDGEDVIALEEHYSELSLEKDQLEQLGLPTSFGSKTRVSNIKKSKNISGYTNHCSEIFSEEELSESNEELSYTSDMEEDLCLHNLKEKVIKKKKKKNRNLKLVPKFILEEKGLLKYWKKRFSLFSLFDRGIRMDRESWFSVTPEKVAFNLAKRLSCDIIIDGFCGCGGNAIQFAKTCRKVIAIDIDPTKVEMAKHNAGVYGVSDKIDFIVGDFIQLSKDGKLYGDIVFLSPPWGGPKYKSKKEYDIDKYLLPIGATELAEKVRSISKNFALFLPRNANMKQIIKLAGIGNQCEVEHNYLDSRLVAITALYGEQIITKTDRS